MKVAITGKGGVGKTTFASTLCRLYAAEGRSVLAADVDPDANLGLALGLTAVGIIIQCLIFYGIADSPSWTNVWLHHGRNTVVYNLVGLAVMLGIMHLDYSFVGRHPAGQAQISAAHGADAGAKRMIALKSVGSAGEWRFLLRDFFAAGEK